MEFTIKQSGSNPNYPEKGIFWKYSEINIPTWVTDNLAVIDIYLDKDGKEQKKLKILESNTSGISLFSFEGEEIVSLPSKNDGILIWDGNNFFGVTEKQFKMLYEKI